MALSDPQGILASPLAIIRRTQNEADIEAICQLAKDKGVAQIVVGLPRKMNGNIGAQAQKVQAFIGEFQTGTEIPVVFRDERLTTVSAKRLLREIGKKGADDDAVAAALILQSYLDEAID